jgi:hypothetical protein
MIRTAIKVTQRLNVSSAKDPACSSLRGPRRSDAEHVFLKLMDDIANVLAREQCTADFLLVQDQNRESEKRKAALKAMRVRMKELTAKAWADKPGFAEAAKASVSDDNDQYVWAVISPRFSDNVVLEELPADQQLASD